MTDDFIIPDPDLFYNQGFESTCYGGPCGRQKNPYPDGDHRHNEYSRGQLDGVIDYQRCIDMGDDDSWSWDED